MDPLTPSDLLFIAGNKFPVLVESSPAATDKADSGYDVSTSLLSRMISFNRQEQYLKYLV